MRLTCDLTGVSPEVQQSIAREIRFEDRARYTLGVLEQRRLAQLSEAVSRAKYAGELRAKAFISQDQWLRAMNDYGQLCWADPDFMPWLLKRPEGEDMRVRDAGSKIMSGWTPGTGRGCRFHKSYA